MATFTRGLAAGAALLLVYNLLPEALAPPRIGAERGVRRALIKLNELLAAKDIAVVDEFVASEDTLMVGSAAGEVSRGRDELEAHYRKIFGLPGTYAFSWRAVEVSCHGPVAWLHAEGDLVVTGSGPERRVPYRLTAVLEQDAGRWKWRLFHGSQPTA